MEMTRERISFTFDPRDMLVSLQMGFSFVRAAVACAILEGTSGLEPSSETTAPRSLKLVTVPNFCPFTFISLWMPLALLVYTDQNVLSTCNSRIIEFWESDVRLTTKPSVSPYYKSQFNIHCTHVWWFLACWRRLANLDDFNA